jgi:phospholipid transport system transporter-binding protein
MPRQDTVKRKTSSRGKGISSRAKKSASMGHDSLTWMKGAPKPPTEMAKVEAGCDKGSDLIEAQISDSVEEIPEVSATSTQQASDETVVQTAAVGSDGPEEQQEPVQRQDLSHVALQAQFSIALVTDLHTRLLPFLQQKESVEIDASEVELVDTAALQLLVAFVKALRDRDVTVNWNKPSDTFCETARLLDLSDLLGLEQGNAGEQDPQQKEASGSLGAGRT